MTENENFFISSKDEAECRAQGCPQRGPCARCKREHQRTPGSVSSDVESEWRSIFGRTISLRNPRQLVVGSRLVPVITAQVARYRLPERFPNFDTWTTPVHKVMDLRGHYRAQDLKDYLGLARHHRLILSTVAPDPYVEMLWRLGGSLNHQKHAIDEVMPGHFSSYDSDSAAHGRFNIKRQQIHGEVVESPWAWHRLGRYVPLHYFRQVRHFHDILISCQSMRTPRARALLARELAIADRYYPATTRFWFVSRAKDVPLPRADTSVLINQRWLYQGLCGRDLRNKPLPRLPIREVLFQNLHELALYFAPSRPKAA